MTSWDVRRTVAFCDETGVGWSVQRTDGLNAPAAVLIGPEGGFTAEERTWLRALPWVKSVTLGPRILRAETAAVAALTLWQAAAGDWRGGLPGAT